MKKGAFTLTELLVVIAIIGVLVALIFPVMGKVRERAQATICLSNLKQIGVAIGAYAADHKGELPVNDSTRLDGGPRWYLTLNPYVGKSDVADWRAPSVFICAANDPNPDNAGQYKIWTDYGYRCNVALMPLKQTSGIWYPGPPMRLNAVNPNRFLVADSGPDRVLYIVQSTNELPYQGKIASAQAHNGGVHVLKADFSVFWMKAEDMVSAESKKLSWY